MAPSNTRKLNVYEAQIGFYETVVAAPSRAAALRAWGTHQDLFAHGEARATAAPAAIAAALEHPNQPLRRPLGSNGAFLLDPVGLPSLPDPPNPKRRTTLPAEAPKRQKPSRAALDAAEADLRKIEADWKQEDSKFEEAAETLQARRRSARQTYAQTRKRAEQRLDSARAEYRKADDAV